MEILKEAQELENVEVLEEAKKKARKGTKAKIKDKYNAKKTQALKIANKLKARKNNINWTDDIKDVRNEVVAAFMANDADKVIEMMTKPDGYKTVEILKALETAHGGYKRLESKSGDKKNFIKTVFAYIDAEEEKEEA
jgi:glycine betaine/choline ABC-type transport system substrate-binding protein